MKPETIRKKLKELDDELLALSMSLTDEVLRENIDYIELQLALTEAGTALNEALKVVEERIGRMN